MEASIYEEIAEEILKGDVNVQSAKARVCGKHRLNRFPSNADILSHVSGERRELLKQILKKKPVRSLSGVAVVAVMTSPAPCPHGRCLYCPAGENAPQSYTGFEPAALRGRRAGFDPYRQVSDRLKQLHATGHNTEKIELIVMGGTFPARGPGYQEWFVRRCFDAMNSFGNADAKNSVSVLEAQRVNEKARVRSVGVTFETRPDYAREPHVDRMLFLGGTRAELGVQTLRDDVLDRVKRGHSVEDVIESTRILKDAGLKVCYHMMPGLFSSSDEDLEMFRRLFSSQDFRPDMLKIYPTLVMKGTGLYELWRRGGFKPPELDETVKLIVEVKRLLPKWVRTMRIQRDIPAQLIAAGIKKGNLGELVEGMLSQGDGNCRCIRCREAGHLAYKKGVESTAFEIMVESYESSYGLEHFISAEDPENDVLAGYLRLRFPSSKSHRPEIDGSTAVVRELKVLGEALRIGEKNEDAKQHRGIGRELLLKAEEMAVKDGRQKMLVTSAVGTRGYYRKLGFKRLGPYMAKGL